MLAPRMRLPGTSFEGDVYCWRSPAAQLCVHPAGSRRAFDLVCPNPALLRFARSLAAGDPASEAMTSGVSWCLRLDCPLPSLALLLGWQRPCPSIPTDAPVAAVVPAPHGPTNDRNEARGRQGGRGGASHRGNGEPPVPPPAPRPSAARPAASPRPRPIPVGKRGARSGGTACGARARPTEAHGASPRAVRSAERAAAERLKARFRSLLRRFAEREAGEADLLEANQSPTGAQQESSTPRPSRRKHASRLRRESAAHSPRASALACLADRGSEQLAWLLAPRPHGPLVRRRRKRAQRAATPLRRTSS